MEAHYGLGYTLLSLDRPHDAYRYLRYYTELTPANAWAWCFRGQAAEAMGEPAEARDCYQRAVELERDDLATDAGERLRALASQGSRLGAVTRGAQLIVSLTYRRPRRCGGTFRHDIAVKCPSRPDSRPASRPRRATAYPRPRWKLPSHVSHAPRTASRAARWVRRNDRTRWKGFPP